MLKPPPRYYMYEPEGPVSWSPDKHKKSVYAQRKI